MSDADWACELMIRRWTPEQLMRVRTAYAFMRGEVTRQTAMRIAGVTSEQFDELVAAFWCESLDA